MLTQNPETEQEGPEDPTVEESDHQAFSDAGIRSGLRWTIRTGHAAIESELPQSPLCDRLTTLLFRPKVAATPAAANLHSLRTLSRKHQYVRLAGPRKRSA